MPQSTNPFDPQKDTDSLSFDQFTFEELEEPSLHDSSFQDIPALEDGEETLDSLELQDDTEVEEQQESSQAEEHLVPVQTQEQLAQSRLTLLRQTLGEVHEKVTHALELLDAELPSHDMAKVREEFSGIVASLKIADTFEQETGELVAPQDISGAERTLEGVFDGQSMIGSDGKKYTVPQNYASKSKLVEGDIMKLTITSRGSFIYKQIGPVERTRVVGNLEHDHTSNAYYVRKDGKRWQVLSASITYFRGKHGDEVVLIVPRDQVSSWGAVENVIRKI